MDIQPKILFLSNRGLLPIRDGHTRRSFNILKGIARDNWVYYLSFYESEKEIEDKNIRQLKTICKEVEFYKAPSKKINLPMLFRLLRSILSFDPYTIWRHYSSPFAEKIKQLIESNIFDIVHCDVLPLGYTIRGSNNIFRSITDHDVSYLKCRRMCQETRNLPLKLFLYFESLKIKYLEQKIFEQVNLGITVSELDKRKLQKICPRGKFFVVENGVEVDWFKPGEQELDSNTILWVGGFDYRPNRHGVIFFLNNVYPLIKKSLPGIKFEIIGGGITKRIRRLAAIDKSIALLGYVDDPLPFIQMATVFAVPILSGGGTRLKVLEAMSVEKVVVTTKIGCEGIPGSDGVHFVIADEANVFAEAIIKVICNPGLRNWIGQNARQFVVERYNWKNITKKLNMVYREIWRSSKR